MTSTSAYSAFILATSNSDTFNDSIANDLLIYTTTPK